MFSFHFFERVCTSQEVQNIKIAQTCDLCDIYRIIYEDHVMRPLSVPTQITITLLKKVIVIKVCKKLIEYCHNSLRFA